MQEALCKKLRCIKGSSIVEAAIVFPLVIMIAAGSITLGIRFYTQLKNDSDEHRIKIVKQYPVFEKGRFLIGIHGDDICISDDTVFGSVHA